MSPWDPGLPAWLLSVPEGDFCWAAESPEDVGTAELGNTMNLKEATGFNYAKKV